MRTKKRFPVFYTVYLILVVLALILIHCGLGVVKKYLAEYESVQPKYLAAEIFEEYYSSGDFKKLIEACPPQVTPYEDSEAVSRYLSEFTKGKEISYSRITSGLDASIRYIVKADDIKFSSFTLTESQTKSKRGMTQYELSEFEIHCTGNETFRITAPKGYTVSLNGVTLDASAFTGNETRDVSWDYMPEGVDGITYCEYVVDGLYFPPTAVTVVSPDSREYTAEKLADGSYRASVLYDEAMHEEHSAYALEAAEAIAKYMQNDASFYAISAYLDRESDLYQNVRTSLTQFVIDHVSYSFEDESVTEFYSYDENTFSCRVSFTHVLKYSRYSGLEDYRDYIDTTYFFRRVGDKFQMYARYNH